MWHPDLTSPEMHRLRATAAALHAQLIALQLTPAGGVAVEEVRGSWGRGAVQENSALVLCLHHIMQRASP